MVILCKHQGADRPVPLCSLISTFDVHCLDSIIPLTLVNFCIKAFQICLLPGRKSKGRFSCHTVLNVIFYSLVLAQVKDFLPRLALSNQHLQQAVENGENVDIENVEDTDGPLIQMVGTFNHMWTSL